MQRLIITLVAGLAIATGLWQLDNATRGVTVTKAMLGSVPVTVLAPASGTPSPAIVIAHGFAGSQQLMQPFAVTLARNGFIAVTFDFPGHGRNAVSLPGGLENHDARTAALLATLDEVVTYARHTPGADGRIGLLGHSMASDIVVQYAKQRPSIEATVGVSLYSPGIAIDRPRNLLVIDGAWEPAMLRDEARRIVGMASSGPPEEHMTYGRFTDGTARRFALADGVEHIAVLYSQESMAEALEWLRAAFGRSSATGFLDSRGAWLGLLLVGVVALARPLASLLPPVAVAPLGASLGWRKLASVAVLPALLTPLLLWKLPTDFLPILLGDYLAMHYAIYGLLTVAGIWLTTSRLPDCNAGDWRQWQWLLTGAACATVYGIFAIGLPLDRYVISYVPGIERLGVMLALLLATLPYFIADEWLTRGTNSPAGAYAATKFCFLLSLVFAIGLNLERLFFLAIIVPAILIFFVVYGMFSRWIYRATGHPLVAALASSAAFAWAIGVTFPLVSR